MQPQALVAPILRLQRPRPLVLECRVVGAPAGAQVAYFRDITQADELDRAKSRFVATAAHELRTPIAVITGYAEFLQASDPPPGQRGEILATMRRHGDQIAGIVSRAARPGAHRGAGGPRFHDDPPAARARCAAVHR